MTLAKEMIIRVSTKDGKVLKCVDEHGNKAEPVIPTQLESAFQSTTGVKHVTLLLHAHASPGCVIIIIGGTPYKICT